MLLHRQDTLHTRARSERTPELHARSQTLKTLPAGTERTEAGQTGLGASVADRGKRERNLSKGFLGS